MTLLQQVVKQYPDTEAGTWAKSDLEVLQADKAFLSALDQHHRTSRAKSLLALAESYLQNGQPQIAAKNYKQVLTEFPHTEWAAKAEVKLEEIKDAQEGK